MNKPYPGVEGVLDLWMRQGRIDHTHKDALLSEVTDDIGNRNLQVDGLKKIIARLRHHVSTDNICDCPAHLNGQPHRAECLLLAVAEVTGETPKTDKRNPPCQKCGCIQAHAPSCPEVR